MPREPQKRQEGPPARNWPEDGAGEPSEEVQKRVERQEKGDEKAPSREEFERVVKKVGGGD